MFSSQPCRMGKKSTVFFVSWILVCPCSSLRLLCPWLLFLSWEDNCGHWLNCMKTQVPQPPLFVRLFPALVGKGTLQEYMEEAEVSQSRARKEEAPRNNKEAIKTQQSKQKELLETAEQKWAGFTLTARFVLILRTLPILSYGLRSYPQDVSVVFFELRRLTFRVIELLTAYKKTWKVFNSLDCLHLTFALIYVNICLPILILEGQQPRFLSKPTIGNRKQDILFGFQMQIMFRCSQSRIMI